MADTQRQHPQRQPLALWLAIALTTAAIVRVGLWRPPAPRPAALNPAQLQPLVAAGWRIRANTPDASSGEELSWARGVELINADRHPGAVVSLVPVQARGPYSYVIETLVRPVIGSGAELTKLVPFGGHERARLKPRDQQQTQPGIEAACLSNGVATAGPKRLLPTKLNREPITGVQQQLERLVGLRQTRAYDCLLVVVRAPGQASSSGLWPELAGALLSPAAPPR